MIKVVDIKSLAKCQIITKVYKGLTVKCLGQLSGMCQVSVRINPVCAQPLAWVTLLLNGLKVTHGMSGLIIFVMDRVCYLLITQNSGSLGKLL